MTETPHIPCAACRCPVLGTAIGEVRIGQPPRMWHPACYSSRTDTGADPGLRAVATDLAAREQGA